MKQTTKVCPECGNTKLILLPSMNKKVCLEWKKHKDKKNKEISWCLDEGQKSVY